MFLQKPFDYLYSVFAFHFACAQLAAKVRSIRRGPWHALDKVRAYVGLKPEYLVSKSFAHERSLGAQPFNAKIAALEARQKTKSFKWWKGCQRMAHVVNVPPLTELGQSLALRSMVEARTFAKQFGLDVDLFMIYLHGEALLVPRHPQIRVLPEMKRSSASFFHHSHNSSAKRFPFLKDILQSVFRGSDAKCIVWTNPDIGLMPSFYLRAAEKMRDSDVLNAIG